MTHGARVVVTGAAGFVGRATCLALSMAGCRVAAAVRRRADAIGCDAIIETGDLESYDRWPASLAGARAVIHLAARVHIVNDRAAEAAYVAANVDATRRLALAARAAGVRRFVFASTCKVLGESDPGRPFQDSDPPHPQDGYARSKAAAENVLRDALAGSDCALTILRPPLVYGPGVRANFLRLLQLCDSPWPLPLGAGGRRSMIYVENLADMITRCVVSADAIAGTFLAGDDSDWPTGALVAALRQAMGRPARLIPVPIGFVRAVGRLTGRTAMLGRLYGSLQLDSSGFRQAARWAPPISTDAALARTVGWYLQHRP